MLNTKYGFSIQGIEPRSDPAWQTAPEPDRRAYWRRVIDLVLDEYHREREEGIGVDGNPLFPLATKTILYRKSAMGTADHTAPPLIPAHGLSRTESLLDGRAFPDHAEFFWRFDEHTGVAWGKILDYHRQGAGHLPARNVMGLSLKGQLNVQLAAGQWWRQYVTGRAHGQAAAELRARIGRTLPRPGYLPPGITPTGRTDFENFTFGIGGGSSVERARQALAEGYVTGFRQRGGATKPYLRP